MEEIRGLITGKDNARRRTGHFRFHWGWCDVEKKR